MDAVEADSLSAKSKKTGSLKPVFLRLNPASIRGLPELSSIIRLSSV